MALLDWWLQKPLHNINFQWAIFHHVPTYVSFDQRSWFASCSHLQPVSLFIPLCFVSCRTLLSEAVYAWTVCVRCVCVCVCGCMYVCTNPVPFISWSLMCQLLLRIHSSRRCLCCSVGPLRTHQAIRRQLLGTGRHKIHPLASLWIIFRSEGLFVWLGALEQALWDRDLTDWRLGPVTHHMCGSTFLVLQIYKGVTLWTDNVRRLLSVSYISRLCLRGARLTRPDLSGCIKQSESEIPKRFRDICVLQTKRVIL